ncbi:hypothetical protein M7775_02130 [Sporomusa sphaeroides DSM 2875]|uniref:Mor transcription activator family protein n=1 Tax=Sporomusa sphaeroides TaxID=47679 RepID=UPI00203068D3|nr:Mor transcription activator family protein [Sporomusa sphaeroides]MCM0757366.1 hypothetical protein [Sporomusa sphaeroides DSM 2875]
MDALVQERIIRERIIKEIRPEDLTGFSPATTHVLRVVGPELFAKICEICGGVPAYFPKLETITAPARDRLIIQDANNYNYAELAMKYGISEVWVRKVVNRSKMKQKAISLFQDETGT